MSKKILIVDDCLELRKLVFLALDDSGYQLSLASSADEAMGLLGDSPPDLIVLDVMMPGKLNGYQFCLLIKNTPRYRSVKVLLLTARSQKADILEGIRVKSDGYMVKPFSPTMLQIKVAELLGDSDALSSESPPESGPNDKQGRIGAEVSFPPRPENLVNIRQEMNKDQPDIGYIAQQIAGDIKLSATLLRTVNSPFYGLRGNVTSISQAINMLGLARISTLVTAISARESVPLPKGLEHFWEDTLRVATLATSIARSLKLDEDLTYLMGLFHDVGMPLIAAKYPEYPAFIKASHYHEQSYAEAEYDEYNTSHTILGSLMARAWHLPSSLVTAIKHHHAADPFALGLEPCVLDLICISFVADHIHDRLNGDIDIHYNRLENNILNHLHLLDEEHYQIVYDRALESLDG